MEVLHMNQRQLANRWGVSEACLERWRSEGIGPQLLKLRGRVMYRQVDIEAFEESCLQQSQSKAADPFGVVHLGGGPAAKHH